jgi:ABC-2 type transport system permease protein
VAARRPAKASGWRLFVRTALARAYPRVIGGNREKAWVFFEVVLPLLALSAYVFVYRGLQAPEEFVGFVILGGAMSAFWLNVMWAMASQLYWEKETGNLSLFIMVPGPLAAVLLGMALGGILNASSRAVVILAAGIWLFDAPFQVADGPMLAVVFVLTLTALYGMGMMFASVFLLLGREAWHFVNLAQEPVFLLSGTYFPIRHFPGWIAAGASLIPLTLGLDAIRQLVFESGAALGFLSVGAEALALLALTLLFLAGAGLMLAYMERLAIAEGKLTVSGA